MELLKQSLHWLHLHPHWAGFITFLIALSESIALIGLIVPGTVVMTAIGTLIGAHVIPFTSTVIWAILGAIAGDGISYGLGYYWKNDLHKCWPFSRFPSWLPKGEQFFQRHGGKSILLGRFIGPIRPIIPLVAGSMKMSPRLFFITNVASGIAWAPLYLLPGILLGTASLEMPPAVATKVLGVLFFALLILWSMGWLFKRIFQGIYNLCSRLVDKQWKFLRKNVHWHGFTGLLQDPQDPRSHAQLTRLLFLGLLLAAFMLLALFVALTGSQHTLNESLYYLVRGFYVASIAHLSIALSFLAYKKVVFLVIIIMTLYLLYKRQWHTAFYWLGVNGGTLALALLIKHVVASPRPAGLTQPLSGFSFPSGHTTAAFLLFGTFAVIMSRGLQKGKQRLIIGLYLLLGICIALSRLYLGAHWLTDVIGGSLWGGIGTLSFAMAYHRHPIDNLQKKPMLLVFFLPLLLTTGFYCAEKTTHLHNLYKPASTQTSRLSKDWWTSPSLAFENTRLGKRGHPLDIQWASTLDNIKLSLTLQGWKIMPPRSFLTFLTRLVEPNTPTRFTLLARLYQNQGPAITFYKLPTHKDAPSLILRLWPADVRFMDSKIPLWYGRLAWQYHIKSVFLSFGPKQRHHYHRLANPRHLLAIQLSDLQWKFIRLSFPNLAKGKRRKHAEVLLISTLPNLKGSPLAFLTD